MYIYIHKLTYTYINIFIYTYVYIYIDTCRLVILREGEGWGAGVETQKNVRGEIGGWVRVPFNEPYAPSLSTIYDGA